jgi:hypothetical protein
MVQLNPQLLEFDLPRLDRNFASSCGMEASTLDFRGIAYKSDSCKVQEMVLSMFPRKLNHNRAKEWHANEVRKPFRWT